MLSILIPSYNHASFVTDAIASALRINVPGKRIYVIDDASPDNSAKVIDNYLKEVDTTEVTFICKPVNKGVIDSLITFLSLCNTPYVYILASDDIVQPEGIARLVGELESRPELQFIIGGGSNVLADGSRTPLYGRKHDRLFGLPPQKLIRSLFLTNVSPLLCQSSVFRLLAIRAVNGFDPTVAADDYALFTKLFRRFCLRGINFDFMPEIDCVRYRHHGSNSYSNLVRQACTTRQVIDVTAPEELRTQAAGYKLAAYMLMAIRRLDLPSIVAIAKLATPQQMPWLFVGLFVNAYRWIRIG